MHHYNGSNFEYFKLLYQRKYALRSKEQLDFMIHFPKVSVCCVTLCSDITVEIGWQC